MLDRLKSLPLTIFLTILIWMYAESQVNSRQDTTPLTVSEVPVWVSGPPDMLAKYDVTLADKTVGLTVTGPTARVESMRRRVKSAGIAGSGINAYLDVAPDDRPTGSTTHRRVRPVLPDELTLVGTPEEVGFKLTERSSATSAAQEK